MAKSASYMARNRAGGSAGTENTPKSRFALREQVDEDLLSRKEIETPLAEGERVFAKDIDGKTPAIIETADGKYIFRGYDNQLEYTIDKNSDEYKQVLRSNNIKAQFREDGSVTVARGGLYDKKRTFKDIDSFEKESNRRLDNQIKYWKNQEANTRKGQVSQIQAENLKVILRNSSPTSSFGKSDAGKFLSNSIKSDITQWKAAEDMKLRLETVIDKARKRK